MMRMSASGQSGYSGSAQRCLLLGVKQTSIITVPMSLIDPNETRLPQNRCCARLAWIDFVGRNFLV
jgi:hypothetical protein